MKGHTSCTGQLYLFTIYWRSVGETWSQGPWLRAFAVNMFHALFEVISENSVERCPSYSCRSRSSE